MEDSQALQIAISSILGITIPNKDAQKILDTLDLIKSSPDSTTIKELKEIKNLGCACYGNNSIHKCHCK